MSRDALRAIAFCLTVEALVALSVLCGTYKPAFAAGPYTAEDTINAIDAASAEIGVDWQWLYNTVGCETGWSFSNYRVGRQGEVGAVQLHPRGELPRFYQWGYLDPHSPYQSVRFLAQRATMGGAGAWTCS